MDAAPALASSSATAVGFGQDPAKKFQKNNNKKQFYKKGQQEGKTAAAGAADGTASGEQTANSKEKSSKKGGKKGNGGGSNANDEPYIIIIKNAENDLCRIHEEALPHFLGLNVKNQEKRKDGASYYEVKVRSETRTAELNFYGEDESAFFKSTSQAAASRKPGEKSQRTEEGDEKKEPEEEGPAATTAANNDDDSGIARFACVADMIDASKERQYFNSLMRFAHHRQQHAADGTTTAAATASSSTAASEEPALDEHGNLRSLQEPLVSAVAEVNQKTTPKALRKMLDEVPGFLSCWFLKVSGPALVTFRVVFRSEAALFAAKELLDQFDASEQGARVTLKLSDNMMERFQQFSVNKSAGN